MSNSTIRHMVDRNVPVNTLIIIFKFNQKTSIHIKGYETLSRGDIITRDVT